MSKLNASVETIAASQEEIRNTFPAQPERNPRGQNLGSTSGCQRHEQAKAVTILRSGKTLERDFSPPKPLVIQGKEKDKGVKNLEEKDEPEDRVVEDKLEDKTYVPIKERPTKWEFIRRLGKEPMVEDATKHPLPVPYPQRLKKDKQEMQSQQFFELFK